MVEPKSTRSNTIPSIPKVRRKSLKIWHQEAFLDACHHVQRPQPHIWVYGRMVGGRSEPRIDKQEAIATSTPSSPHISPLQAHNSPIHESDSHRSQCAVETIARDSSTEMSPPMEMIVLDKTTVLRSVIAMRPKSATRAVPVLSTRMFSCLTCQRG